MVRAGKYFQGRFKKSGQKNRKDQQIPTAPAFTQRLETTPENERHRYVFPVVKCGGSKYRYQAVAQKFKRIGQRANVVTAEEHFATPQDIRRGFGTTMAYIKKVSPYMFQKLMRLSAISTTVRFYAEADAEWLQEQLREEPGGTTNDLANPKLQENLPKSAKPDSPSTRGGT